MRKKVVGVVMVSAIALAGYATADAYDVVPGVLTREPHLQDPAPFLAAAPVSPAVEQPLPVTAVSGDAPMPSPAVVQRLAEQVRADARTGDSTNVSVIDVVTGQVLADVDAADPQVPASSTKLLTAISAVADLGPEHRLETSLVWDAASRTLALVAGGDMMLAADGGHQGAIADANGWAGLGDLARTAIEAAPELRDGPVTLVVDDLAFEGPAINPDWPQYAITSGYVGPASGLAVDIGRTTADHYARRHDDPSLAAGEDLKELLADARVSVAGEVTRASAPGGGTEVATVESAPLSMVSALLLRDSDNTIAEIVARVHALETGRTTTPAGAAAATRAGLAGLGAPVDGLELYDGAGFSDRNRIAPVHLTGALIAALDHPATEDLLDWLPVGGLEGTVASRYMDTPAAGMVRAKTGSLTGVTALAGTVATAEGRLLAFAIMADGMPYGPAPPRAAFDDLVNALAGCGCDD